MLLPILSLLSSSARTFTVSGNTFLKDGQPYRYVGGSYHYFRDEPSLWEDRIRKMAAGGLNAVQTYVAWNLHEPTPGTFSWTGRCNIELFLDICNKYNMTVILRPGPYICAEWAIGGFPYWLMNVPGISTAFRSSSRVYMDYVERWFAQLYPRIASRMYSKGGPITLVQIENEYGSFGCDHAYMNALADLALKHLGADTVLITADNPEQQKLDCGSLPSRAVVTLNFGSRNDPRPYFALARQAMGGTGPYVASEYWTDYGNDDWVLPQWGRDFPRRSGEEIAYWLDRQLQLGASVNMYMYYGGSNWAYAGAGGSAALGGAYEPDLPSYDYDAPLSEAGDLTDKFARVRDVVAKYLKVQPLAVANSTKAAFGPVKFTQAVALAAAREVVARVVESDDPRTLEELDVPYGYVVYETDVAAGGELAAHAWDHGVLSVNGAVVAKAFRPGVLRAAVKAGDHVEILVEQLGRLNWGPEMLADRKGLRKVTVGGQDVRKWRQSVIPLGEFAYELNWDTKLVVGVPAFYRARFEVEKPEDTFFNPTGLNCGVAFVNGVHIGHYWKIGPQLTLYVRAQYLKKGTNELVVFETGSISTVPTVTFDAKANIEIKATAIQNA